jgi:hypothetical protein
MLQQKSACITAERGECYEKQETAVPPSVEHIACGNYQQILPLSFLENKPVEQEYYGQEHQKL